MVLHDDCMWLERCLPDDVCSHYTSFDDDGFIDELIEERRYEFYKEWFEYIGCEDD